MAQHSKLLPGVAILLLIRMQQGGTHEEVHRRRYWLARCSGTVLRRHGGGAAEGGVDRRAVRPHRADARLSASYIARRSRTISTLINSKGGVEGYKIKADEIDNEYKVPQAVEAYERQKADGRRLDR